MCPQVNNRSYEGIFAVPHRSVSDVKSFLHKKEKIHETRSHFPPQLSVRGRRSRRCRCPDRLRRRCFQHCLASSAAASSEAAGESVELIVFAAASLTETLNAIAQDYSAENPGVTFRFNFDSSGTLKTQIQEGADCDLFISAGQKQMNQLDITASADVNIDGLDFVDPSTRVDLLENKVVLCVPRAATRASTALMLWPST